MAHKRFYLGIVGVALVLICVNVVIYFILKITTIFIALGSILFLALLIGLGLKRSRSS